MVTNLDLTQMQHFWNYRAGVKIYTAVNSDGSTTCYAKIYEVYAWQLG